MDAVIDEQVGRKIRIGDRWLTDWASCNYLGFDLDEEIIAAVPEYLAKWGTHPSWSRLLGNPRMYPEIEEQLTELLGTEDTLVLPTITHIHMSVIPVLVGDGTIFLDGRAHKTIYDGAMVAAGHGATVVRFRHNDHAHLEEMLRGERPRRAAHDRDGRRELDDGQRARPGRVRAGGAGARRAPLRRRRPRVRRDRRAVPRRALRLRHEGQQRARAPRGRLRERRAGGRLLEVLLVAAGLRRPAHPPQGSAEGAGPARTSTRGRRPWPRSPRRSPGSR